MSLVTANMVMEKIEQTALKTYLKPSSLWVRYVDDVYASMKKVEIESFHNNLIRFLPMLPYGNIFSIACFFLK